MGTGTEPIALIGIGCRMPGGVTGPSSLWNLLVKGVDAICPVPADRWDNERYYSPDWRKPGRINTRHGGFLHEVDGFDAGFFGVSGRVANQMDPQQRLLLEVCWEAFEDGGVVPGQLAGSRTGVFMGACSGDYAGLQTAIGEVEGLGTHSATGMYMSILSNRLSYTFDLHGPSMTIDTACSSSLVAVHLGCESLRRGESELVLAGGVNLMLVPQSAVALSQASMLSPDGRSRAFDAAANGYVRGEGAGVVVLKRLAEAQRDRDRIYAVIRGSSVNQDGRTQGITVPSSAAQGANFRAALVAAGIGPREVGYVEAHGTGTPVGDPIEANALGKVLADGREPERVCYIGSIKTNIGHLEAGAGVAGLIKAALSVHHRRIAPTVHFQTPNPEIAFDQWQLAVSTSERPWPSCYPRVVASVNSFGFGGTNANVVLEAAAAQDAAALQQPQPAVLTLSAHSDGALRQLAFAHAERLDTQPINLQRLAANLAVRRSHHSRRLAVVATDPHDAVAKLRAYVDNASAPGVITGTARATGGKLAFLFNGQGPQWYAMGRTLLETNEVFRAKVMECDELARPYLGWSIREALNAQDEASSLVQRTSCLQPTMFAIQIALAELWSSWGVVPDGVAGHSMGEIAAAHVSGGLDLASALKVICLRARIQEDADSSGGMMFVALPKDEALALCAQYPEQLWLAAENGPRSSTLSGRRTVFQELERELDSRGVFARTLRVNCACHSPDMDPLHDQLIAELAEIEHAATAIPMYSTVTGSRIEGADLGTPYWWRNFRQPVLFAPAINTMLADGFDTFVELSPHPVLVNSLREILNDKGSDTLCVSSLTRGKNDWESFLSAFGTLHTAGHDIAWQRPYPDPVPVDDLPTNPWIHQSFWNESPPARRYRAGGQSHPMLKRIDAPRPTWEIKWGDHRLEWATEHEVLGSVIVPGAAYVEATLAAAHELTGASCALEFMEFQRACVLEADAPQVSRIELDPDDGTFEIHSRAVRDDGWTRTARGRFHPDPLDGQAASAFDLEAIQRRCTRSFDAQAVYDTFTGKGYIYGAAFRGISHLRVGAGESLARVEVPEVLRDVLADYLFHPALLDACLQVAILHPGHGIADELLPLSCLPTGIDRARVVGGVRGPVWCYTRASRLDAGGLSGDVFVLDDRGNVVAEFSGLQGKVVSQPGTNAEASIDNDFYRLAWTSDRLPRPCALTIGPTELQQRLEPAAHALASRLDRRRYGTDYQTDLRHLCVGYITQCLSDFGHQLMVGQVFSLQDFPGLVARYERPLARMLRILVEDGVISERDGRFLVDRQVDNDLGRQWAETLTRHPDCLAELLLIAQTGERLHDVFTGKVDPLELLFPGGSQEYAERVYQNSPTTRFHHTLVRRAIEQCVQQSDRRRTLRVLEVGGGTGGLTSAVLPVLPPDRSEYVFTDVSATFTQRARERFRDYDFIKYHTYDLERSPQEQGIAAGSFDLVLASDAVHAVSDLKKTLLDLQEVLAPGGVLALVEAEPGSPWGDLTFGLTEGWWAFRDVQLRREGPLLSASEWGNLLRSVGYDDVVAIGDPEHSGTGAQTVLLAQAPPPPSPHDDPAVNGTSEPLGDWVIIGDSGGLAAELANRIKQCGGRAVLTSSGKIEDDTLEPEGVVQFWNDRYAESDDIDGVALEREIRRQCLIFTDVVKALDGRAPTSRPRLYLVTRGAHAWRNDTIRLEGAPAWGLGLVAGLEQSAMRCRMIDLDAMPAPGEPDAVWAELRRQDQEHEVALRAGERFVRRLLPQPADRLRTPMYAPDLPADTGFALHMDKPGPMDDLRYRARPRHTPADGEVEIQVVAAGLNFRDVMFALGQVPPPRSSRGMPFGGECSGLVTRVGDDVTGLHVGDAVVAISSIDGTIASHVVMDSTCVLHMPEELSWEQAATIPVAFLTAWYTLHELARLRPGERVLIHSASGGTGLAAIQIAQLAGAEVFATAGSPQKRALLRALGVRHVMDSRSLAFADQVRSATDGAGVDVVLNATTGEAAARSIACLAPYGRFVEIGKRDLLADRKLGLRPFTRNLAYFAFDLSEMVLDRPQAVATEFARILNLFRQGVLTPLPHRIFHPSQAEAVFRQLAGAKHIGKLVMAMDEHEVRVHPAPDTPRHVVRGTWLITGGLGGVGLAMAEKLADAGIQALALVGRSGSPDAQARGVIENLKERGVQVCVAAVDVTSRTDLADLLARIDRELPTLRGVLHCAMVLDDAPITGMSDPRFERVLGPKVVGAFHLHELTAHLPLDAFVLFSSAISLVGNIGQANYAAANAFLDHLAEFRHANGLAALAVNWGAISDVGYVARHQDVERAVSATGMRGFTSGQAFQALTVLLGGSFPRIGVLPIDWQQFFRHHGVTPDDQPRYASLPPLYHDAPATDSDLATNGSLGRQLRSCDSAARADLLTAQLKLRLATVLGVPLDDLDENMPLVNYVDSLLAVEISSWIAREVGAGVTVIELLKGPSVRQLAGMLLIRLDSPQPTRPE
ncbi:type I polyketide synthase [Kribbella antibiotica]|nr:type I polyketide synthase [Kribbella antibiotica]